MFGLGLWSRTGPPASLNDFAAPETSAAHIIRP